MTVMTGFCSERGSLCFDLDIRLWKKPHVVKTIALTMYSGNSFVLGFMQPSTFCTLLCNLQAPSNWRTDSICWIWEVRKTELQVLFYVLLTSKKSRTKENAMNSILDSAGLKCLILLLEIYFPTSMEINWQNSLD